MEAVKIHLPQELFESAEMRPYEGTVACDRLEAGPDTYTFEGPVAWSVEVTNTGDGLLVMGRAQAQATTQCARCLEDVSYDLSGDIEGYYLVGGEEAETPEDLEDDEFEYVPDNHVIDIAPLIEQALLLELPLVPLCDDDCKGLCPHCGKNLNEGPCDCDEKASSTDDNPFAALKNLHFDD
ncbi:DUF177 domain-containing protein [Adlercreutzia equolifaciens]|uniref:YceD family protein n=1 Tax=Adlercreutzia equolifaciens TaxID=446660 RepID=UPI0023B0E931|nr:DUF177 domain-containing protein [Adlercreutzia equolifaciens]MDE8702986.1 DUF177 domain-containing protein [Adlercreutzia equolifaciens]